jgi:predicted HTH transcriptional regulator
MNSNITKKQLSIILNISTTAIDKNLDYLKQEGYIERIGSKKTGYWKVK